MRATILLAFGVALAAAAGCVHRRTPAATQDAPVDAGRTIYERRCAACHGIDARGNGPVAPALRTPPPDLTKLTPAGNVAARDHVIAVVTGQVTVVAHGTREMPVWSLQLGSRSGATTAAALWKSHQLEQLADYLEALQVP